MVLRFSVYKTKSVIEINPADIGGIGLSDDVNATRIWLKVDRVPFLVSGTLADTIDRIAAVRSMQRQHSDKAEC